MRLKSSIWVSAYLRRCQTAGASVVVVRRGDNDAGAIYICVNSLDGRVEIYGPAPAGLMTATRDRSWIRCFQNAVSEEETSRYLGRQIEFDPDLWIVEVEDRSGRHFLEEADIEELR
jgi:hypothetical protein